MIYFISIYKLFYSLSISIYRYILLIYRVLLFCSCSTFRNYVRCLCNIKMQRVSRRSLRGKARRESLEGKEGRELGDPETVVSKWPHHGGRFSPSIPPPVAHATGAIYKAVHAATARRDPTPKSARRPPVRHLQGSTGTSRSQRLTRSDTFSLSQQRSHRQTRRPV